MGGFGTCPYFISTRGNNIKIGISLSVFCCIFAPGFNKVKRYDVVTIGISLGSPAGIL